MIKLIDSQIDEESKPTSGASFRSMADLNYDLAQYHWYNDVSSQYRKADLEKNGKLLER